MLLYQFVAANRIKDTPTSQIGGLTDGFREIKGRIDKGDKKLHSPMSGKWCVYYAFAVTESSNDSSKEIISDKKSTRCYLDAGTGTAAIELDEAELVLDVDHHDKSGTFNSASPKLETILKRYGKNSKGLLFNKELQYEETILEVGDELYVLGPAKMVKGTIGFKAIRGQPLIVSDKSERDLLQTNDSKCFQFVLVGVVQFIIAFGCLAYPDKAAELIARSNDTADREVPRNESTGNDTIREAQQFLAESRQSTNELNRRMEKWKEESNAHELAYELRQAQNQERYEKATANFKKRYDTKLAHYNRGNALRVQGKMDEAIDAYKKSIEVNPNYAGAHYNLGRALSDQEKPDEAIDAYKKAIELNPNYAEAHCNLGHVLKRQSRFAEALRYLKRGHELGSKNPQWKYPSARWVASAHYSLGIALNGQGKLDEAIDAYKKAIEVNPNYAEAHCNLGYVLKRQRRFAEALHYLERGHELGSKNPQWKYPSARWVEDVKRQAELAACPESRCEV
jgi:tetratricopeptide (TPR) repeat protein